MAVNNSQWFRHYDFDQIIFFARKRFVDGCDTITLLKMAKSDLEKEEIILISLLDIDDDKIKDIQLQCRHASRSEVTSCRHLLKQMRKRNLL
jgi:hypothetical protein